MFKLASMFVDIKADQKPFDKAMDSVHARLGRANMAAGVFAGNMATMFVKATAGFAAGAFDKTLGSASELNNAISKTEAIFGTAGDAILTQADKMAEKYGAVKKEYIDAAAAFGASFKQAGKGASEAVEIGNKLADLGMDLAARYGGSNQDAFTALASALRGEMDPIEKYNVGLNQAAIEQEAMSLGLIKTASQMDLTAKKTATLSLIYKQTKDAQGAMAQTAGESDNQMKKFWGTLENLGASIGQTLMPAFDSLLVIGTDTASGLTASWQANMEQFRGYADTIVGWVGTIGTVWRNLGNIWELTTLTVGDAMGAWLAQFEMMATDISNLAGWLGENWYKAIADAFNATASIASNFADNMARMIQGALKGDFDVEWTPILTGFEATMSKLPEAAKSTWKGLEAEKQAVIDRMNKIEEQANPFKPMVAAAAKKTPAAGGAGSSVKAQLDKFTSEILGASDFASKLRAAQLTGKDDIPSQQLDEQKKTRVATEEVAKAVKAKPVAVFG